MTVPSSEGAYVGQGQGLSLRAVRDYRFTFLRLVKDCKGSNSIDNSQKITVQCYTPYRYFWRRARDFFGVLPYAFASLRSLTTDFQTVHRTVFIGEADRPCSNPSFCLTNSPNFIRNYFMGVQLRFREVALLYRNHEIDLLPGIKIPLGIYPRWYDKRDLLVK